MGYMMKGNQSRATNITNPRITNMLKRLQQWWNEVKVEWKKFKANPKGWQPPAQGFTVVEILIILVIGFCLYKVIGALVLALAP